MKRIMMFFASTLALLAVGHPSPAAWGPSGCAVAQIAPAVIGQQPMKWHAFADHPNQIGLYNGNTLIGKYNYSDGFYRMWLNGSWSGPAKSPIPPPFGGLAGQSTGHSFGAITDHVGMVSMATHNGHAITEADAAAILGASIPTDHDAASLTYVDADKGRREKFVKDAAEAKKKNPKLDSVKIQAYDPNAAPTKAMMAGFKLDADKQFAQAGKVIYAQLAPKNGDSTSKAERWYGDATPEVIVDALRVIDPNWNPNIGPLPSLPTIPDGLGLLLAAGFVTFGLLAVAVSNRNNP